MSFELQTQREFARRLAPVLRARRSDLRALRRVTMAMMATREDTRPY